MTDQPATAPSPRSAKVQFDVRLNDTKGSRQLDDLAQRHHTICKATPAERAGELSTKLDQARETCA